MNYENIGQLAKMSSLLAETGTKMSNFAIAHDPDVRYVKVQRHLLEAQKIISELMKEEQDKSE